MADPLTEGLGNITGSFTNTSGTLLFVVAAVFIIGTVFLVLFLIWRESQFKYFAIVQKVSSETGRIDKQYVLRARKFVGKNLLQVKGVKMKIPIPKSDLWVQNGKTEAVYLQYDGIRLFVGARPEYYVKKSDNSYMIGALRFTEEDYGVYEQMCRRAQISHKRHANIGFMEKYGPQLMFIATVVLCMIIIIGVSQNVQKGLTDGLGSFGQQMADAWKYMADKMALTGAGGGP